jgi:hypothetical protein
MALGGEIGSLVGVAKAGSPPARRESPSLALG